MPEQLPVVDLPNLSASNQTVNEDLSINVGAQFSISLIDLDGSQSFTYTIEGIPAGYLVGRSLSGATTLTDLGGGSVRFDGPNANDVINSIRTMTLTPAGEGVNSDANFVLNLSATTVESGGATANGTATHTIRVRAVADAPINGAVNNNISVHEDPGSTIAFPLTATLGDTDGSEVLSQVDVTIISAAHAATLNPENSLRVGGCSASR